MAIFRTIIFILVSVVKARYASLTQKHATCGRRIVVGVDYYPEQWPLDELKNDMWSIKNDLGADLIRIGEFMWHELQPKPGTFNFTFLDRVLDIAEDIGLEVMLATPTATMPAWLHAQHPEVMGKGPDSPEGYAGAVPAFGGRRQYSFNSERYLDHARTVVQELAKRYGKRHVVTFWQIDNELGHEGSDLDFSEQALFAWREWLRKKYGQDIAKLNADWGTVFWGVTYNDFEQIPLPRWTVPGGPARSNQNFRSNNSPGMLLDYRRFRRDSITNFAEVQVEILRRESVNGCITTNAPGGFWSKAMDHNDIFESMDLPAYDNYPVWGGSVAAPSPFEVAITLDTIRGWSPPNQSGWMVAEQLIGAQGHDIIGYNPRPGQVQAWAAASLLHGATSLVFFRYRAAVFGQEEFCYGILDHTTPRGQGRKWEEAKSVFKLAKEHSDVWLGQIEAKIALVYDAENIFAWQAQPQSVEFDFATEARRLYAPFWQHGASIDVISVKRLASLDPGSLVNRYKVVLLPVPMLTSDSLIHQLIDYVHLGGSLWVSFRADLKDERSQIRRQPSRLAGLAGVQVEEIESLNPGVPNTSRVVRRNGTDTASIGVWREGLRPDAGVETLWSYTDNFFGERGFVAVTRRRTFRKPLHEQKGEVVYVGAGIDPAALRGAAGDSISRQNIANTGLFSHPNVERLLRRDRNGKNRQIEINHGEVEVQVGDDEPLQPFEVRISAPELEI